MCTISIVPHRRGVRVACNRDELRSRPPAEPPAWRRAGSIAALWPRDPAGGGTWIGVNAAGIAMALLNRNPQAASAVTSAVRSRGTIIPTLLCDRRLETVLDRARTLPAAEFQPFTLVIVHRSSLVVIENHRRGISVRPRPLSRPVVFTSSSLGDHLVVRPRRALFRRLVERAASPLRGQAAFHRHRWPGRPEVSVWMARPDAATVSRTVLDLTRHDVRIGYQPIGVGT